MWISRAMSCRTIGAPRRVCLANVRTHSCCSRRLGYGIVIAYSCKLADTAHIRPLMILGKNTNDFQIAHSYAPGCVCRILQSAQTIDSDVHRLSPLVSKAWKFRGVRAERWGRQK